MAKKKKIKISKTLKQNLLNTCIQISESLIGGPTLMSPTNVTSSYNPAKQAIQKIQPLNSGSVGNYSTIPNNMVSVQPMTPPVGKIFYFDTSMTPMMDNDEILMQNELNGTPKNENDKPEKINTFVF